MYQLLQYKSKAASENGQHSLALALRLLSSCEQNLSEQCLLVLYRDCVLLHICFPGAFPSLEE